MARVGNGKTAFPDKNAQDEKDNYRFFSIAIENAFDHILITDPEGKIIYANKAVSRITGYPHEKVIGNNPRLWKGPATSPQFYKKLWKTIKTDRKIYRGEITNRRRNGEIYNAEISITPLMTRRRQLIGFLGIERDISSQKKAVADLKASEEKYRALAEQNTDIVYSTDAVGRITYIGPQIKRYGFSEEQFIGVKFTKTLMPDDRKVALQNLKRSQMTKSNAIILFKFKDSAGNIRWMEESGGPIFKDGKYAGLVGILRDVTERKLAQDASQRSSKMFEDIVRSSEDMIWEVDRHGRYTYISEKSNKLLGYSPQELIGKTPFSLMRKSEAESARKKFLRLAKGKKNIVDLENWNVARDGREVCLLTNAVPILDERKNVIGYRGVDKDKTQKKLATRELEKSEERYRSLFEKMLEGFALHELVYNMEGKPVDYRYVDVNPAFEKLTWLKRDKIVGKTAKEIHSNLEDEWFKTYIKVAKTGKPAHFIGHAKDIGKYFEINAYSPKKGQVANTFYDVTGRKLAQELLEKSEKKYRELFNAMKEGFAYHQIITDDEGKPVDYMFLDVNPAFEKLTGLKREGTIGKKMSEVLPSLEKAWTERYGKVALGGGSTSFIDYSKPLKKWYEVNVFSPKKGFFATIFNDVTEIKKANDKIREDEEKLRLVTDNIEDMLVMVDGKLNYTYLSPSHERHLGYKNSQMLGTNVSRYILPEDMGRIMEAMREVIARKKFEPMQLRFRHKNGKYLWLEVKGKPIFTDGRLAGGVMVARDITQKLEAERKLRAKQIEQAAILNNLPHPAWLKDADGRYVTVNRQFMLACGRKEKEIIGRTDMQVWPRQVAINRRKKQLEVIKGKRNIAFEEELATRKGRRWYETYKAPIFDSSGKVTGTAGVSIDISQRKKYEEFLTEFNNRLKREVSEKTRELIEKNRMLEEHENSKNEFLINIGHELKTPLAVVELNLEAMKNTAMEPEARRESETMIGRNILRLKDKIEEIIQLSRLEKGGMPQKEKIDLVPILDNVVKTYTDFASSKGLELKYYGPGKRLEMEADARLIVYAINNLLSNAVKFSSEGTIYFKVSIKERHIEIRVADTGKGVSPADRKNLFTKYYKADPSGPGTGVGLYITQQIVQKHGGHITFEPNRPKGSVFIIRLPLPK
ncbi:MAG: PAS domain S-box protein [Candidatus Micrarchaeia archaeon]